MTRSPAPGCPCWCVHNGLEMLFVFISFLFCCLFAHSHEAGCCLQITMIFAFFVASAFFYVVDISIDTILLCFCIVRSTPLPCGCHWLCALELCLTSLSVVHTCVLLLKCAGQEGEQWCCRAHDSGEDGWQARHQGGQAPEGSAAS